MTVEGVGVGVTELSKAPREMNTAEFGLYRGVVRSGPREPVMKWPALRRKRWIYLGICMPEWVLGVAVVDLGFASNAFAYVGERGAKRPAEWKAVASPWAATVDRHSAAFSGRGGRVWATLPEGDHAGVLEGEFSRGRGKRGRFALTLDGGASGAVTCVAPAGTGGDSRWNLTIKNNTVTAGGVLEWAGRSFELDAAPVIVDVTEGYPARRTVWRWASGAGRVEGVGTVGFNFCALHNDSDRARENVLWVDGVPRALGRVRFGFDRFHPDQGEWSIEGERVSLKFTPWGMRDGYEDMGLVESRFVQPYGVFHGVIDGVKVDGVTGVVEDHEAYW